MIEGSIFPVMDLEINAEEKGWLNISLDGEFFRRVAAPLFRKKLVRRGYACREDFIQMFSEIERRAAKEEAYRLLSVRDFPSRLLIEKLENKGISEETAVIVAEELKDLGYISDKRWLIQFIKREFQKGTGPKGNFGKTLGKEDRHQ